MYREFVKDSNRGTKCIDWAGSAEARSILSNERKKKKSYKKISEQSVELFSIFVSKSALCKAAHRYLTPGKPKSSPKLGLTRFDYDQMPSGTTIRVNGVEIVLP